MTITIRDRVVVFDYGEVISVVPRDADRTRVLQLAGVDADDDGQFWEAYWRHRNALDQGTADVHEYWRLIARDLRKSWDMAMITRLWIADFRSWLTVDIDTLDVLTELKEGGTRMALLSNAGADFASYYRHGMLGQFFEKVFVSGEMGAIKPNPEIYKTVLADLAIDPATMVFIDNREINIRGAEALGITGHVFTDAHRLRAYLESLQI